MKLLDMKTWPRREAFNFFKTYEFPHFNICTQVDITRTHDFLDRQGISKYNAVLWMISCAANHVKEMRYRIRDNTVVAHDRVDPAFTLLTDDHTLAFCTAEYNADVSLFFDRVNQGIEQTKANPAMKDKPGIDNLLYVSCVPWINFTSVSHPVKKDPTVAIPRISWGKFTRKKEQVSMPVSLQLHHGLADGYHAGLFFKKLADLLDQPQAIAWPVK